MAQTILDLIPVLKSGFSVFNRMLSDLQGIGVPCGRFAFLRAAREFIPELFDYSKPVCPREMFCLRYQQPCNSYMEQQSDKLQDRLRGDDAKQPGRPAFALQAGGASVNTLGEEVGTLINTSA